jgi:23S rRNA pseudouridine955/2504/2580 synthase
MTQPNPADRPGLNADLPAGHSLSVGEADNGKSLVRFILKQIPGLTAPAVYQALRHRDIRLNDRRLRADAIVKTGDQVRLYLPPLRRQSGDRLYRLVYSDDHVLIVRKSPGLPVDQGADGPDGEPTLIDRLRRDFDNPAIALCHRLDRQTGGLILAARHKAAAEAMRLIMQQGLVGKRYRCLVAGIPDQGQPVSGGDSTTLRELHGWLEKDAGRSTVYVHDNKQPGDRPICTRYRVLRVFPGVGPDGEAVSDLEIELVTGRTHQIRAHLAHIGHPLLGDGKYGRNRFNQQFRGLSGPIHRQQLWATSLLFGTCPAPLTYLSGRSFQIEPEYDWQCPAGPVKTQ